MTQIEILEVLPSLRERVYAPLEHTIIHGELPAGTHLKEDELARKLGVSRNPVREALQQLVHEGMADYVPTKGVFVHTPTDKEISDVLHVRMVLECEAARLAASQRTRAQLDNMSALVRDGREALATKDTEMLLKLNERFHHAVVEAAGNSVLEQSMEMLQKRVNWYFAGVVAARAVNSWDEHEGILDALREGNVDLAGERMEQHVHRTQASIEAQKQSLRSIQRD